MKTKLIHTLILAAAIGATHAQQTAVAPSAGTQSLPSSADPAAQTSVGSGRSSSATVGGGYRGSGYSGGMPGASSSTFQGRLNQILGRANPPVGSTVILTSPLSQKKLDEIAEDLGVLNYIFTRNLERTFDDKTTEYRLGVPMTLNSRLVETVYIQPFGVLIKVHVPFPVATAGQVAKKAEATPAADSEWEKARRALSGGPENDYAPVTSAQTPVSYDEKLVASLKRQMIDALKNASNLRNIPATQSVTVAIFGGAENTINIDGGSASVDAGRPTVLTIQMKVQDAVDLSKGSKTLEDFNKQATINSYFASASPASAFGGMSGGTVAR